MILRRFYMAVLVFECFKTPVLWDKVIIFIELLSYTWCILTGKKIIFQDMADTRERSLSIVTSLTEPRSACNTWNINTIEKTSQLNILTGVSNMKWENTFLILGIYFAFYLPEPHELWQLQAPSLHHRSCQPEFTLLLLPIESKKKCKPRIRRDV